MEMPFAHLPVLARQVVEILDVGAAKVVVDGTVGGGGHAALLLEQMPADGVLIGLDRDKEALRAAAQRLAPFGGRAQLHHANFSAAAQVVAQAGFSGADAVLFDLGVSSYQLDNGERGFSFRSDAPLDMRMDRSGGISAADLVATCDGDELALIFKKYGEERWAKRIARAIVRQRQVEPLLTTTALAALVADCVPRTRGPERIHPATRVFQALRIAVNDELTHVERGVSAAIDLLNPGGVLAVISFHSLEDRLVKNIFRNRANPCTCPPRLPQCACGKRADVELLSRRGIRADEAEVAENPRSRSAVLRAVRRL